MKITWYMIRVKPKKTIRQKKNNVVLHLVCYSEEDLKNGWLEAKKNFFLLLFGCWLPCLLWLLSWWSVHRCCGAHSVKLGWLGGGIERRDVGGCCKPKGGNSVRRITFCVCFCPSPPCFLCSLLRRRQFCERKTLATLSTTEQMFASLLAICWGTRWMC